MKYRTEFDSIGKIKVPGDKYWGASTERSNKYFNIGDFLVRPIVIQSIAIIKKAAAIVNSRNNDTLSIGCTAEITQITAAEGDTGEYDILVTGVERFIVKSYNYSKDYKQAYVKTWQDIDDSIDETLLQETNVFLYEVLMKLGASSKISQISMPKAAFEIASMLDLDKRAKKMLLKSQSEKDRLIILKRILKKAIVKIDYDDPAKVGYHNYSQFEA